MPHFDNLVIQHLTVAGDGTGASNFVGDYTTPVTVKAQPAVGDNFEIHSLSLYIKDTGNFDADEFGGIAALTNGLLLEVRSGTTVLATLTLDTIKDNGGAMHFSSSFDNIITTGPGDNAMLFRWNFVDTLGEPVILCGKHLENIAVTLSDNLTGLVEMEFIAHGHKVPLCTTASTI